MLLNRSFVFWQPILAVLVIFFFAPGNIVASEECSTWEKKLKKEQQTIIDREEELSLKTSAGKNNSQFDSNELERLIQRHHASIETFNQNLDNFNRRCTDRNPSKSLRVNNPEAKAKNPEAEVQASKAFTRTLKGYFIQAGAFKQHVNASSLKTRLAKDGLTSFIITRPYVYALWVGPFRDQQEANDARETLLTRYKIKGYLIYFK